MKSLKKVALISGGAIVLIYLVGYAVFNLPAFGGSHDADRLARYAKSPRFKGDRFVNDPPRKQEPFLDKLTDNYKEYTGDQIREPRGIIPVVKPAPADFAAPPAPGLRAYWFGHASVLIEIDGVRVMTDPVFSKRASPFQFVGPARFHETPISLKDLPPIHAVLISHDHYDHLDMDTVKVLAARGTHFYVGLGIGAHLERWGVGAKQIHEMDWWEQKQLKGVTIHCVPTRHYSGRKSMDDSTLWSAWFVKGSTRSTYYSGDTGYGKHFSEIRARLGAPDLSIIKVGAYGNGVEWLDVHMTPEDALRAHRDLGARVLLPVHWATFMMAYHDWDEPIIRTLKAASVGGDRVVVPRIGERFTFGRPFRNTNWWKFTANARDGKP